MLIGMIDFRMAILILMLVQIQKLFSFGFELLLDVSAFLHLE